MDNFKIELGDESKKRKKQKLLIAVFFVMFKPRVAGLKKILNTFNLETLTYFIINCFFYVKHASKA